MVNGAMTEFSSAVSGNRPTAAAPVQSGTAASREHAMAANRDYISQPRLRGGHLSLNISCQDVMTVDH
ncbi:hypothetical protein ILYODFUR_036518 [Ilyodon furcidens]|uniref:Uncharacterized protein n=1 Tax=Ilyodon furcidens TaxID=33524 RepID=A0ABV0V1Z6_9TELE